MKYLVTMSFFLLSGFSTQIFAETTIQEFTVNYTQDSFNGGDCMARYSALGTIKGSADATFEVFGSDKSYEKRLWEQSFRTELVFENGAYQKVLRFRDQPFNHGFEQCRGSFKVVVVTHQP